VYDIEEYYWAEPSFIAHRKGKKGRAAVLRLSEAKSGAQVGAHHVSASKGMGSRFCLTEA
jgi:hypothetical protein